MRIYGRVFDFRMGATGLLILWDLLLPLHAHSLSSSLVISFFVLSSITLVFIEVDLAYVWGH